MTLFARASSDPIEWHSVSLRHPCRVCGATSACRFQDNETLACCANDRSEWPLVNGAWLHRVAAAITAIPDLKGP